MPFPPFSPDELSGTWDASNGHRFTLGIDGTAVTLGNIDDETSCWDSGIGSIDLDSGVITAVASSDKCTRHATGTVKRTTKKVLVDQDYEYVATTRSIHWKTTEGNHWPVWSLNASLHVDMTAFDMLEDFAVV